PSLGQRPHSADAVPDPPRRDAPLRRTRVVDHVPRRRRVPLPVSRHRGAIRNPRRPCARLPLQFPRREPATLPRLAALRRVGAVVHLARATPTPSRPDACDDVEQLRHLARLLGPLGGELAPSARTTHARRRPRARAPPPRT